MNKKMHTLLSLFLFCTLLFSTLFLGGCANKDRKVFVYGFGFMPVPETATIEDIDALVIERYGTDLFWSSR